jgi:alkylation response protein AidB-like acyl-CoA dehydrogenase
MTGFLFDDGPDELRQELRELMAAELPGGWLGPFTEDPRDKELSDRFCRILADRGLLIPEWPVEYGGRGLELERGVVIREEMWAHGEPRGPQYYGPNWVGPSIMQHGTEAQRLQHLPPIAEGRVVWCQGFSEPGAGSDLAALSTRAVRDGDGFRITGQKVWTSWARWAQWCYLLARTPSDSGDPRDGITVFLIPMDRAGIEVRPIDGLPGPHHLNEVFLDDVRAERAEVLGEVGAGWRVMRDALAHERVGIARYARSDRVLSIVAPRVAEGGVDLRRRWLEARIANRVSRVINRATLGAQTPTEPRDVEASAARLLTTRADQQAAEVALDAVGDRFAEDRYSGGAPEGGMLEFVWRYARGATIASGTTEMLQLRIASALRRGRRLDSAPEAAEAGDAMTEVATRLGGVGAARRAIEDPAARIPMLAAVAGMIEGLDPRDDAESALVAGELARRAGRAVLPVPVEALLLVRPDGAPVALASARGVVEHGDLLPRWILGMPDGRTVAAAFPGALLGTRLGEFLPRHGATGLDEAVEPLTDVERGLALALPAWWILGACETALDLAQRYAEVRVQFGRPIIEHQAMSFPLATAFAELSGLRSLAEYTGWRILDEPATSAADALALRWHAVEVARRTLGVCHQVLGAIGLTYEHDLAIVTAQLQPRLRLPFTPAEAFDRFDAAEARTGFRAIFAPRTAS